MNYLELFYYSGLAFCFSSFVKLYSKRNQYFVHLLLLIALFGLNILGLSFYRENLLIAFPLFGLTFLVAVVLPKLASYLTGYDFDANRFLLNILLFLNKFNQDEVSKSIGQLVSTWYLRPELMKDTIELMGEKSLKLDFDFHGQVLFFLNSKNLFELGHWYIQKYISVNFISGLENENDIFIHRLFSIFLAVGEYEFALNYLQLLERRRITRDFYLLNIVSYLQLYAHVGLKMQFYHLLQQYVEFKDHRLVKFWEAILLLNCGDRPNGVKNLANLSKQLSKYDSLQFSIRSLLLNEKLSIRPSSEVLYRIMGLGFPSRQLKQLDKKMPLTQMKQKNEMTKILVGVIAFISMFSFYLMAQNTGSYLFDLRAVTGIDLLRVGALSSFLSTGQDTVRLISSIFLHGGWIHLFLNLYGIFILGQGIERFYGKVSFLLIFLISGLAGNLISLWGFVPIGVGASGGVFGLLASYLVLAWWIRHELAPAAFKGFLLNFGFIIIVNIVFGLSNNQINNFAHLGGFVAGFLSSLVLLWLRDHHRRIHHNLLKLSFVLIIGTGILSIRPWYKLYYDDYFSHHFSTSAASLDHFEFELPAIWKIETKGTSSVIFDYLTGANIYISSINKNSFFSDANDFDSWMKAYAGQFNSMKEIAGDEINLIEQKKYEDDWNSLIVEQKYKGSQDIYYRKVFLKPFNNYIAEVLVLQRNAYSEEFMTQFVQFIQSIKEK